MKPVFRIERLEEAPVPFDTLALAMTLPPRNAEACIRTSAQGVCLAQAAVGGLTWALTAAGHDVMAFAGWRRAS